MSATSQRGLGVCAVLGLALSGCGFEITPGVVVDAMVNDEMADHDAPPQPSCLERWLDGTISFGLPRQLAELGTPSYERDPFLSPDELTIWFSSGRAPTTQGGGDLYRAMRSAVADPFGPVVRDALSSSDGIEEKIAVVPDGLLAIIASTREGVGGADLWETRRSSPSDTWATPNRTYLTAVNTVMADHDPSLSDDGLHLYYSVSAGPQRILVARRTALEASFSLGAPVIGLGSQVNRNDGDPAVFGAGRVIVFYSTRDATLPSSLSNLWYATRAGADGPFTTVRELPSVNSVGPERDPHVSRDGCRIYFVRDTGEAEDELFVATAM